MNYIESVANKFGWAIQEVILNQLILSLEDEIGLTKLIKEENDKITAANLEQIAKLKEKAETAEEAAEYDNLNPSLIDTRNKEYCLNFWFEKLLQEGKTLLHNVDEAGNLTIKIFKLEKTVERKIKTSYNVTYS